MSEYDEGGYADGPDYDAEASEAYAYDQQDISGYETPGDPGSAVDPTQAEDDAYDKYLESLQLDEFMALAWDENMPDGLRRAFERALEYQYVEPEAAN